MKIVISPAKSLNYESELPTAKFTSPEFIKDAEKLNKILLNTVVKAEKNIIDLLKNGTSDV